MDEEDVTLYINCRNEVITEKILDIIEKILKNMNFKYKRFEFFYILKIQLDDSYEFFVRFINQEKDDKRFINAKYEISDQDILDYLYINNYKSDDKEFFKYIFGNFIRGEF